MATVFTVIGVVLLINSFFSFQYSNFNLGLVLLLLAGLFFFFCGVFYKKICAVTKRGIGRAVKIFVLSLMICEILLVSFLAIYGFAGNVDYREDVLVVLGAGVRGERVSRALAFRLDRAVEYYQRNPDVLIAVCGGQGPEEDVTEAFAMEKYLVARGVPQENIVKEEESASTLENMLFARGILDRRLGEDYSVAVISNDFHMYRAGKIAYKVWGRDVARLGAKTPLSSLVSCYLRESLGVLKMWVFD